MTLTPLSLPLEVFEMIVGEISFVDLPYFLQTSKSINSQFRGTKYRAQLDCIYKDDLKELYSCFRSYPRSWIYWSSHDILQTYLNPYCQECGDYGMYFLWCSVPVQKLCAFCLGLSRYKFIELEIALEKYKLKKSNLTSMPKLSVLWEGTSELLVSATLVFHDLVIRLSETDEIDSIHIGLHSSFSLSPESWKRIHPSPFGHIKISRVYSPQTGRWMKDLICYHCYKGDQLQNSRYRSMTTSRLPARFIPRNYECLLDHISKQHPSLIQSYKEGWNALSPTLRSAFLNPQPEISLGHHLNQPPQMLANLARVSENRRKSDFTWISWSYFAYSKMTKTDFTWGSTMDLVVSKMDHVGSFFGVPSNPVGFPNFPNDGRPVSRDHKLIIADKVLSVCMTRAQNELRELIKRKVTKEGVHSLKAMLEGDSILGELQNE